LRLNFASSRFKNVRRVAVWILLEATYRLEYRRDPKSWEGEPAPGLELPIEPGEGPNGILEVPAPGSLGELRPVEVPDMG
jgi:hypothetical protein